MDPILERHRDDILALAARHGVSDVRVFGSRARGEASSDSDLDLLVQPGSPRPFFFPGGLVADLETALGCRVDVVTPSGLAPEVRDAVLAEARPL